jgi:type III secretion protein R
MRSLVLRLLALLCLTASSAYAQRPAGGPPNPIVLVLIIGAISLAPFLAIMMTSFIKLSVVLALIKSGLGTQVPPGQVTHGLALVLTIFIMAPVADQMYQAAKPAIRDPNAGVWAADNLTVVFDAADKGKAPLRRFLLKHAHAQDRAMFLALAQRLDRGNRPPQAGAQAPPAEPQAPAPPAPDAPQAPGAEPTPRPDQEFRVILPAFVTSELKGAFQIGFLVLLPFLVIDVVVANVLVASGLTMIQPAVVSLPLKILLFVVADGWYLIVRGLVLGYA